MLIMDRSIYLVLANGYTIGQDYEQLHRVYVDSITLDLNAAKKRCQEIIDGINVINELSYYLYEDGDKYSWQEANVIEIPLSKLEEALHSSCHLLGLFGQEKTITLMGITWGLLGLQEANEEIEHILLMRSQNEKCVIASIVVVFKIVLSLALLFDPLEKFNFHIILL